MPFFGFFILPAIGGRQGKANKRIASFIAVYGGIAAQVADENHRIIDSHDIITFLLGK